MNLQDLRRNYTFGSLRREELPDCPLTLFQRWWVELQSTELPDWFETNAMTLSTQTDDEGVASRTVLLKGLDEGFCFFTNYESDKGQQLAKNPRASLHFFWPCFERQVRVRGLVSKTSPEMSDQYFAARPRSSQLGAIASPQSQVLPHSQDLQELIDRLEREYEGSPIPRPSHWGGYRLTPFEIEFWQGRPSRLHDRFRYQRVEPSASWTINRLAP